MSTAIASAIIEQLQTLDEQRQAEVLDFVQFLIAKSGAASVTNDSVKLTRKSCTFDPMRYSGTVQWPVDGMAFQKAARKEWE